MKYHESHTQSAEFLRLALPLMAKQAAALHPISYAIWYEYVAGINSDLKTAVDELTRDGSVLDEAATVDLFRKHISELDEETAQRVSSGFNRVLTDMSQSAAQAGDHAQQFGSALELWSEGVAGSRSATDSGMGALLSETREMQTAMRSLKGRLNESQLEIRQLQKEVRRVREDALADGLTGLLNRKGFDLALAACFSTAEFSSQGPSLLIADIDHFKKCNDTFGHLFGDKVIRAVAQVLKENVKGKDTAARYGGEEFVVLLPDTTLQGAAFLAEKIRKLVEGSRIKRTDNNETVAKITLSLGAACYQEGESASEFVDRADKALYVSKNQGRNRVTLAPLPRKQEAIK